jgi:nucleoside-diphosphate-sugar epimerase
MILVTGATGFIGRHLVKHLLKNDYNLRVLVRNRKKAADLFPKAEIVKGDILSEKTIQPALKGVGTVIHLAGLVSYSKPKDVLFEINYKGTKNLLKHCKDVRFIFSSSVSVYGPVEGVADENYPTKPASFYGQSKLKAEESVATSGTEWLVFRIAPVYGAGSPSWLKNLKLLEKGFPIPNTKNLTHLVHLSDVVQAFEKGLKRGRGVCNIADRKPVKFLDFATKLVQLLGIKPKVWPFWLVRILGIASGMGTYLNVLTMNRHYNIKKAEEIGFRPEMDFDEGIEEMVKWYRKTNI